MESKIQIDIDTKGMPQLRIEYKLTDDLRDKLIGRFLSRMGIPADKNEFWAFCRLGHEAKKGNGRPYDETIVFIEPMDENMLALHMPAIKSIVIEADLLKKVDEMCVQSLAPDLYQRWTEVMWSLKDTRKALKDAQPA